MKKGNVGVVVEILGKKLKEIVGKKVDLGLTGKDGVVHPSLMVKSLIYLWFQSYEYTKAILMQETQFIIQ